MLDNIKSMPLTLKKSSSPQAILKSDCSYIPLVFTSGYHNFIVHLDYGFHRLELKDRGANDWVTECSI